MERRALLKGHELRVDRQEGRAARIAGMSIVYDSLSEDLGGFRERVAHGAARAALEADVRALLNHDPSLVLGRTAAGTLRLSEDARGLAFEFDVPDTSVGRDLVVSVERRDITGVSFAFRTLKDAWNRVGGEWLRTLLDIEIRDISPVTFPAYPAASLGMRALGDDGEALAGLRAAEAVEDRRRRLTRLAELDAGG